jgi:hypothetical protein
MDVFDQAKGLTAVSMEKDFGMSLKEMFGIPEKHSLVNISYEEKGTMAPGGYWTYEERDAVGRLISKIENWESASPSSLPAKNGFRKHDSTGKLILEKLL